MKKKLHQWEPIGEKSEDITYTNGKVYRAIHCRECVKCGLRKGSIQYRGFGTTAYYENGHIHSMALLPFECISYDKLETPYSLEKRRKRMKPKEQKKEGFLSKDEFHV